MNTLLNVNGLYYYNGERITYKEYIELINTKFAKDVLVNVDDLDNNVFIRVKL